MKQFLNPVVIKVTGFNIKNCFSHGIEILSGFHKIPESQNTAVTIDFTRLPKSLLIEASKEENKLQMVKKINISNI